VLFGSCTGGDGTANRSAHVNSGGGVGGVSLLGLSIDNIVGEASDRLLNVTDLPLRSPVSVASVLGSRGRGKSWQVLLVGRESAASCFRNGEGNPGERHRGIDIVLSHVGSPGRKALRSWKVGR